MTDRGRLPDEAIVVRGGRVPFTENPLHRKCSAVGAGLYGFSVQSAVGLTAQELANGILPNPRMGVTTVGEIRRSGYDVIPSPTTRNANHATVQVPADWTAERARELASIFQDAMNTHPRRLG